MNLRPIKGHKVLISSWNKLQFLQAHEKALKSADRRGVLGWKEASGLKKS